MADKKKYRKRRYCCVPHCHSSCTTEISLFLFPKDKVLASKWEESLGKVKKASQYTYVCSLHFDPKDITLAHSGKKRRLKRGAIPSKLPHGDKRFSHKLKFTKSASESRSADKMLKDEARSNEDLAECRACLQPCPRGKRHELFKCWDPPWTGMESTVAEDLVKLTNVQILETDKHSKILCPNCYLILQKANQFVQIVRKADEILHERYVSNGDETWPKPIQVESNLPMYQNVEIKEEAMSDDEYGHVNGGVIQEFGNVDVKIEPEEWQEEPLQINGVLSLQQLNEEMAKINGYASEITPDVPENTVANQQMPQSDMNLEDRIKEEPVSDDDTISSNASDIPLDCLLCSKSFFSVSGLKAHVIAQHSYKTVRRKSSEDIVDGQFHYVCKICQRRFETSTDLMVHETCHNKSICYGCNASFETFDLLMKHRTLCNVNNNKEIGKVLKLEDVQRLANIAQRILEVMTKYTIFCQDSEQGNIEECYQSLLAVITQKEDSLCDEISDTEEDICNASNIDSFDDALLEYNRHFLSRESLLVHSTPISTSNSLNKNDDGFFSIDESLKKMTQTYPIVKIERLNSTEIQKAKSAVCNDKTAPDIVYSLESFEDVSYLDNSADRDDDRDLNNDLNRSITKNNHKNNGKQCQTLKHCEETYESFYTNFIDSVLSNDSSDSMNSCENEQNITYNNDRLFSNETHETNYLHIEANSYKSCDHISENQADKTIENTKKSCKESTVATEKKLQIDLSEYEEINIDTLSLDGMDGCILVVSENANKIMDGNQLNHSNYDVNSDTFDDFDDEFQVPGVPVCLDILDKYVNNETSQAKSANLRETCKQPEKTPVFNAEELPPIQSLQNDSTVLTKEESLSRSVKNISQPTFIDNKSVHYPITDGDQSEKEPFRGNCSSQTLQNSEMLPVDCITADNSERDSVTKSSDIRKNSTDNDISNNAFTRIRLPKFASKDGRLIFSHKCTKKLLPACPSHCFFKCVNHIPFERRRDIFNSFWKMDLASQRDYIHNNVVSILDDGRKRKRQPKHKYTFPIFHNNVRVCKRFFLNTLGIAEVKNKINKLSCWHRVFKGKDKDSCKLKSILNPNVECSVVTPHVKLVDILKSNKKIAPFSVEGGLYWNEIQGNHYIEQLGYCNKINFELSKREKHNMIDVESSNDSVEIDVENHIKDIENNQTDNNLYDESSNDSIEIDVCNIDVNTSSRAFNGIINTSSNCRNVYNENDLNTQAGSISTIILEEVIHGVEKNSIPESKNDKKDRFKGFEKTEAELSGTNDGVFDSHEYKCNTIIPEINKNLTYLRTLVSTSVQHEKTVNTNNIQTNTCHNNENKLLSVPRKVDENIIFENSNNQCSIMKIDAKFQNFSNNTNSINDENNSGVLHAENNPILYQSKYTSNIKINSNKNEANCFNGLKQLEDVENDKIISCPLGTSSNFTTPLNETMPNTINNQKESNEQHKDVELASEENREINKFQCHDIKSAFENRQEQPAHNTLVVSNTFIVGKYNDHDYVNFERNELLEPSSSSKVMESDFNPTRSNDLVDDSIYLNTNIEVICSNAGNQPNSPEGVENEIESQKRVQQESATGNNSVTILTDNASFEPISNIQHIADYIEATDRHSSPNISEEKDSIIDDINKTYSNDVSCDKNINSKEYTKRIEPLNVDDQSNQTFIDSTPQPFCNDATSDSNTIVQDDAEVEIYNSIASCQKNKGINSDSQTLHVDNTVRINFNSHEKEEVRSTFLNVLHQHKRINTHSTRQTLCGDISISNNFNLQGEGDIKKSSVRLSDQDCRSSIGSSPRETVNVTGRIHLTDQNKERSSVNPLDSGTCTQQSCQFDILQGNLNASNYNQASNNTKDSNRICNKLRRIENDYKFEGNELLPSLSKVNNPVICPTQSKYFGDNNINLKTNIELLSTDDGNKPKSRQAVESNDIASPKRVEQENAVGDDSIRVISDNASFKNKSRYTAYPNTIDQEIPHSIIPEIHMFSNDASFEHLSDIQEIAENRHTVPVTLRENNRLHNDVNQTYSNELTCDKNINSQEDAKTKKHLIIGDQSNYTFIDTTPKSFCDDATKDSNQDNNEVEISISNSSSQGSLVNNSVSPTLHTDTADSINFDSHKKEEIRTASPNESGLEKSIIINSTRQTPPEDKNISNNFNCQGEGKVEKASLPVQECRQHVDLFTRGTADSTNEIRLIERHKEKSFKTTSDLNNCTQSYQYDTLQDNKKESNTIEYDRTNNDIKENNRNGNKLQRIIGKGYKFIFRYKVTRNLSPGCHLCKYKCLSKISNQVRQDIFDTFWKMDLCAQTKFLDENVFLINPLDINSDSTARNKLNHSFFLPTATRVIRVCKKFFLATLSISMVDIRNKKKHFNSFMYPYVKLVDVKFDKKFKHLLSGAYNEEAHCLSGTSQISSINTEFDESCHLSSENVIDGWQNIFAETEEDMVACFNNQGPYNTTIRQINANTISDNVDCTLLNFEAQSPKYVELSTIDAHNTTIQDMKSVNMNPINEPDVQNIDVRSDLLFPHNIAVSNNVPCKEQQSFECILKDWADETQVTDSQASNNFISITHQFEFYKTKNVEESKSHASDNAYCDDIDSSDEQFITVNTNDTEKEVYTHDQIKKKSVERDNEEPKSQAYLCHETCGLDSEELISSCHSCNDKSELQEPDLSNLTEKYQNPTCGDSLVNQENNGHKFQTIETIRSLENSSEVSDVVNYGTISKVTNTSEDTNTSCLSSGSSSNTELKIKNNETMTDIHKEDKCGDISSKNPVSNSASIELSSEDNIKVNEMINRNVSNTSNDHAINLPASNNDNRLSINISNTFTSSFITDTSSTNIAKEQNHEIAFTDYESEHASYTKLENMGDQSLEYDLSDSRLDESNKSVVLEISSNTHSFEYFSLDGPQTPCNLQLSHYYTQLSNNYVQSTSFERIIDEESNTCYPNFEPNRHYEEFNKYQEGMESFGTLNPCPDFDSRLHIDTVSHETDAQTFKSILSDWAS